MNVQGLHFERAGSLFRTRQAHIQSAGTYLAYTGGLQNTPKRPGLLRQKMPKLSCADHAPAMGASQPDRLEISGSGRPGIKFRLSGAIFTCTVDAFRCTRDILICTGVVFGLTGLHLECPGLCWERAGAVFKASTAHIQAAGIYLAYTWGLFSARLQV